MGSPAARAVVSIRVIVQFAAIVVGGGETALITNRRAPIDVLGRMAVIVIASRRGFSHRQICDAIGVTWHTVPRALGRMQAPNQGGHDLRRLVAMIERVIDGHSYIPAGRPAINLTAWRMEADDGDCRVGEALEAEAAKAAA